MNGKIYCLINFAPGLTDGLRNALFQTAGRMLLEGKISHRFDCDEGCGHVTTNCTVALIDKVSGVVFEATVESVQSAYPFRVRYLVRHTDLEYFKKNKPIGWTAHLASDDAKEKLTPQNEWDN